MGADGGFGKRKTFMHPDIVVVGAGVAGLSIAWAAARRGAQVAVLDPLPAMGCGATGAAAGVLAPPMGRRAARPWGRIEHAAWDAWAAWAAAIEAVAEFDIGWRPCGIMRVLRHPPRGLRADQRAVPSARACEPACRGLADDDGAVITDRGGVAAPLALLAALALGVRRMGGRVIADEAVRLAWTPDGRVCIRTAAGARYAPDRVVLAAGAATPALAADLSVSIAVTRDAGVTLRLDRTPRPNRVVCHGATTMATAMDGSVLATGVHWGDVPPILTLERLAEAWTGAAAILGSPGTIRDAWCGVRVRGDSGPVVGTIEDTTLAVATGLGGQGCLLSPLLARLVEERRLSREGMTVASAASLAPDAYPQHAADRRCIDDRHDGDDRFMAPATDGGAR